MSGISILFASTVFVGPLTQASEQNNARVPKIIACGSTKCLTACMYEKLNSDGSTPVHIAIAKRDLTAVRTFLIAGINVNCSDIMGDTPLHVAAACGNSTAIKMLIIYRANINARGYDDDTPLHRAACNGHEDIVSILLEAGARIRRNTVGETPLHLACKAGSLAAIKLLITHGANVNRRDKFGKLPITRALEKGHSAVAQFLRASGSQAPDSGQNSEC